MSDDYLPRTLILLLLMALLAACGGPEPTFPQRRDIIEAVYASGSLEPEGRRQVAALTPGRILEILVDEGDTVQAGQVLVRLKHDAAGQNVAAAARQYELARLNASDGSPVLGALRSQVQAARLQMQNDSADYARFERLWRRQATSQKNFEQAQLRFRLSTQQHAQAQDQLANQRAQLTAARDVTRAQMDALRAGEDEYVLTSPVDGRIYSIFKEVGESVAPQMPILEVGAANDRYARLQVDEEDIHAVREGQRVLLEPEGSATIEGVVRKIYPTVAPGDKSVRVDATAPGVVGPAGLSLEANIIISRRNKALVIPRAYLFVGDTVYVKQDGAKTARAVRTGIADLEYVEILSGLDEKTPLAPAEK